MRWFRDSVAQGRALYGVVVAVAGRFRHGCGRDFWFCGRNRVLYGGNPHFVARLWQTGNVFLPKGLGAARDMGLLRRRFGGSVAWVGVWGGEWMGAVFSPQRHRGY